MTETTDIPRAPAGVIQGLWVGSELSHLERLSIASFLDNGHEFHLYVYGDVRNVPKGTVVKDGGDILNESLIFQYKEHKSFSAFANFFRYKLLLEKGGWWVDTDTVCLKPFDIPCEYVFSSEAFGSGELVNCGVVKAPQGSPAMAHAWDVCCSKTRENLVWGEVGPRLMAESVRQLSLQRFVVASRVFCPIGYLHWQSVLDPARVWDFADDVYAVHFWNEMWRRNRRDKNQTYHPDCLYEKLKRRYLV
jgi:Glycosyltransferase sugar-binding region containing DXD motif/Alpha 1,4-glycosyltransferase conserved region